MNQSDQIAAFRDELERVLARFRAEFNLSVAAAVGTLELVKLDLVRELQDQSDDEPPADDAG